MSDPILIIGAGVAGLAAATSLRGSGHDVVLVEAAARIGGRAHTTRIGAHAFDHGATWLHDADRNPLATLATALGEPLLDADATRRRRVLVDGRPATEAELRHRMDTWEKVDALASAAPDDIPYASAIDAMRHDPWTATIEAWEACQIAAADPRDFGVHDWKLNALEGRNLALPQGIGAFVRDRMGALAGPVTLATPVTAIDWRGPILAETARGTLRASACIITVSTSALRNIRFTPALPVSLDGLPMGLLTKIAFRATGTDRLDLSPDESVSQRVERDEAPLSLMAWPRGSDHVSVFLGGPAAWALSQEGPAATVDFVRTRLRSWFGTRADTALGDPVWTDWSRDPCHLGSYAYARPGHLQDRAKLGEPLLDGRLVIAGEACRMDGLAGTVAGAWLDGERAAATVAAALRPRA
jgi:monoamine oxidase